jgi:hypothetical protein
VVEAAARGSTSRDLPNAGGHVVAREAVVTGLPEHFQPPGTARGRILNVLKYNPVDVKIPIA